MFDKESLIKAIDKRISNLKTEIKSFNDLNVDEVSIENFMSVKSNECRVEELWLLKIDIEDGEFDK